MVYRCAENLCLYDGDTQQSRPITQERNVYKPLFSPDGTKILCQHSSYYDTETELVLQLRVIDLETDVTTVLLEHTQLYENSSWWQVDWTPDGEAIAFNTFSDPFDYPGPQYDDLWMVDVATGELTQVLAPEQGGKFSFSPDGTHITVSTTDTISMLRRDGSNRRELVTFPLVATDSEGWYRPMPGWAGDSSHAMALISWQQGYNSAESYATLWHLPLDGPATRGITITGQFLMSTQKKGGLWSPDHRYLAYENYAYGKDLPYNYIQIIAHADGTHPEIYATDHVHFLAWSPDSRHFICTLIPKHDIHLCAVDEPPIPLLSLPETSELLSARWIDAERILCVIKKENEFFIQVLGVDGTLSTIASASSDSFRSNLDVSMVSP